MSETITCRAKVHDKCYNGRPASDIYPDGQDDDNTWDGDSVICDPCFIEIQPFLRPHAPNGLAYEFEEALQHYRTNFNWVQKHANPQELVDEAKANIEKSRPGSPYHTSAKACLRMAQREVERRAA